MRGKACDETRFPVGWAPALVDAANHRTRWVHTCNFCSSEHRLAELQQTAAEIAESPQILRFQTMDGSLRTTTVLPDSACLLQGVCIIEKIGRHVTDALAIKAEKFDGITIDWVIGFALRIDSLFRGQGEDSLSAGRREEPHTMCPEPCAVAKVRFKLRKGKELQRVSGSYPGTATQNGYRAGGRCRKSQLREVLGIIGTAPRKNPIGEHWKQLVGSINLVKVGKRNKRLKPVGLEGAGDIDEFKAVLAAIALDLSETGDGRESPCNGVFPGDEQGTNNVRHTKRSC